MADSGIGSIFPTKNYSVSGRIVSVGCAQFLQPHAQFPQPHAQFLQPHAQFLQPHAQLHILICHILLCHVLLLL